MVLASSSGSATWATKHTCSMSRGDLRRPEPTTASWPSPRSSPRARARSGRRSWAGFDCGAVRRRGASASSQEAHGTLVPSQIDLFLVIRLPRQPERRSRSRTMAACRRSDHVAGRVTIGSYVLVKSTRPVQSSAPSTRACCSRAEGGLSVAAKPEQATERRRPSVDETSGRGSVSPW